MYFAICRSPWGNFVRKALHLCITAEAIAALNADAVAERRLLKKESENGEGAMLLPQMMMTKKYYIFDFGTQSLILGIDI